MAKTNAVIIKKVKKGGHGGHHGGAWKVAYADFVTAMMAFFLLLWLLNATTDAQKRGIADYFSPTLATKSTTSGSGGVMGGRTMGQPGAMVSSSAEPSVTVELNRPPDVEDSDNDDTPGKVPNDDDFNANGPGDPNSTEKQKNPTSDPRHLTAEDKAALVAMGAAGDIDHPTEQEFRKLDAMHEEKQFKQAEKELNQALQSSPDLKPLAENVKVERTQEGLRIQLVDQDKSAMFPVGSSDPDDSARKLMTLVTKVIEKMPNKISITGHTDATPYHGTDFDNYDLSVERARAMRHALITDGAAADRIETVQGKGATEPIDATNPTAPLNRRVSIVLLREFPGSDAPAKQGDAAAPTQQAEAAPAK